MIAKSHPSVSGKIAVAYSFKSKWHDLITQGRINLFFRKNAPSSSPSRVYFYIGAPFKQITGWSDVLSINSVTVADALAMSKDGRISIEELDIYLKGRSSVHVIRTGDYQPLSKPVSLDDLQQKMVFHPPQSFCVLTADDESVVQELGV